MKKLLIAFAIFGLSAAFAETHRVTLVEPSVIKGTQFKAGDCKLDIKDNSVVILQGKQQVEVPVKVVNSDKKFSGTRILYNQENGKYFIQEIQVGGTKTKLTFDNGVQSGGGGQ